MDVSARGLAEIVSHEGIVTRRYRDSVGVLTIGVGHTKAAGPPDPAVYTGEMTVEEALVLFRKDVARYAADVTKAVKVPVTQYEFDALVSFHYNTGAIGRASLIKSLNAGNRAQAAAQFMNWSTPAEIIGRRTKEMVLFRTGAYQSDPKASVWTTDSAGKVQWSKGKVVSILSLLGDAPAPLPVLPAGKATIRLGSKGALVAEWQSILGVTADGDFGPKTETTTKAWQSARGLVPDAVVGAKTWAAALQ